MRGKGHDRLKEAEEVGMAMGRRPTDVAHVRPCGNPGAKPLVGLKASGFGPPIRRTAFLCVCVLNQKENAINENGRGGRESDDAAQPRGALSLSANGRRRESQRAVNAAAAEGTEGAGGGEANSQRFVVAKRWHLCLRGKGGGAKCLSFTAKRNCALSRKKSPGGRAQPAQQAQNGSKNTQFSQPFVCWWGAGTARPFPRGGISMPRAVPFSENLPPPFAPLLSSQRICLPLSLSAVFGTIRRILSRLFRSISEFPNLAPPIAIHCDTNGQKWATRGRTTTNRRNRSNTFVKKDIQLWH
ncbi:hypothetical protein niasHT_009298 [Heterodera trifolii]|uniref:Uncharacterized protein n=1 Tax=Heterodera trifolii TaxID=157864 RepID=A0ABD2MBW8_9BILA